MSRGADLPEARGAATAGSRTSAWPPPAIWAFSALTAAPGARAQYDRCRHAGDRHVAAQRNLFNGLLGILHTAYRPGRPLVLSTKARGAICGRQSTSTG